MRIESDIEAALGSEDSEPSQASEMEVMRPHLMDRGGSLESPTRAAPAGGGPVTWVVAIAAIGLVLSLVGVVGLLFGGVILSGLALFFA